MLMQRFMQKFVSSPRAASTHDEENNILFPSADVQMDVPLTVDEFVLAAPVVVPTSVKPTIETPRGPSEPTAIVKRIVATEDVVSAIEKFQYAMLLAERKSAIGQLQTLWNECQVADECHKQLLPIMLNGLVTDPRDTELMEAMLELMQSLMSVRAGNATLLLQGMRQ
jgi:hypothetical protein